MLLSLSFFFLSDTPPNEIYTSGPTLSLHYALPISAGTPTISPTCPLAGSNRRRWPSFSVTSRRQSGRKAIAQGSSKRACVVLTNGFGGTRSAGSGPPVRVEEHTSELQSLMRTSYAVVCLKKNEKIRPILTHIK